MDDKTFLELKELYNIRSQMADRVPAEFDYDRYEMLFSKFMSMDFEIQLINMVEKERKLNFLLTEALEDIVRLEGNSQRPGGGISTSNLVAQKALAKAEEIRK